MSQHALRTCEHQKSPRIYGAYLRETLNKWVFSLRTTRVSVPQASSTSAAVRRATWPYASAAGTKNTGSSKPRIRGALHRQRRVTRTSLAAMPWDAPRSDARPESMQRATPVDITPSYLCLRHGREMGSQSYPRDGVLFVQIYTYMYRSHLLPTRQYPVAVIFGQATRTLGARIAGCHGHAHALRVIGAPASRRARVHYASVGVLHRNRRFS